MKSLARSSTSRRSLLYGTCLAAVWLFFASPASATLDIRATSGNGTSQTNTTFVWVIEDTYAGKTFFDRFDFFTGPDPTHGTVNFTTREFAFDNGLAYIDSNNHVIMKGDDNTTLPAGQNRNSVRISSQKEYNSGLFILDLNRAPWGCAVWPAWWTVGSNWPYHGEIDILEGVHDNEHNQVTWHTGPGCELDPNATFTGSPVTTNGQPNVVCDSTGNGNAGCGITEWSRASYGPTFDAAGGGVFAMKWDDTGIAVWSFYRSLVPRDVQIGQPNPASWGEPVAFLAPTKCDLLNNFVNHSIIFDITFCGDWAGNSYATSGCPGTCPDRLMDPANFVNATFSINNLTVYRRVTLSTPSNHATQGRGAVSPAALILFTVVAALLGFFAV